jgi:hypothetical protein
VDRPRQLTGRKFLHGQHQFSIGVERPRVSIEIVSSTELGGVHENGNDHLVREFARDDQ